MNTLFRALAIALSAGVLGAPALSASADDGEALARSGTFEIRPSVNLTCMLSEFNVYTVDLFKIWAETDQPLIPL